MNSLLRNILKKWILSFMIVSMVVFNIPISSMADSVDLKESEPVLNQKKSEEEIEDQILDVSPAKENTETEHQTESTVDGIDPGEGDPDSIDGLTMLYWGGGAVAGVGVLAIALGASSSSSDPDTPLSMPPDNPPVGPDLNGTDWAGTLDIKDNRYKGFQAISARIDHSGSSVQINTSSTLHYGRQFNGTISTSGYMVLYDSISGEDWTTKYGNASTTRIDLYDYVNNLKELDRMKLSR